MVYNAIRLPSRFFAFWTTALSLFSRFLWWSKKSLTRLPAVRHIKLPSVFPMSGCLIIGFGASGESLPHDVLSCIPQCVKNLCYGSM